MKTNTALSDGQVKQLMSEMSKVIDLIPRESGAYLMADFEDNCRLILGDNPEEPCACVEIMVLEPIFKTTDKAILEEALAQLSTLVNRVCSIPENRIYVLYRNSPLWAVEGINIEKTLFKGLL